MSVALLSKLMVPGYVTALCTKGPGEKFHLVDCYTTPDEVLDAAHADAQNRRDFWFGACPLKARPANGRGGAADVACVPALYADLDWFHPEAHPDLELPTEKEVRDRFRDFDHPPSVIVATGHGLQPYWLLDKPVTPDEGADLIARLTGALRAVGLKNDRFDLASVLRLPGSFNHKTDEPVLVELVEWNDRRYGREYLDKYLPRLNGHHPRSGHGPGNRNLDRDALDYRDRAALEAAEALGGTFSHTDAAGVLYVIRPGKIAEHGMSIGKLGPGIAYCFTSGWPALKQNRAYSADQLIDFAEGREPDDDAHESSDDVGTSSAKASGANGARSSSWAPVDLTAALSGKTPEIVPTVLARDDGLCLLYPGRLNMLLGEPESCKTWLAYWAAAQQMRAGRAVVWVDLEDAIATAITRLRALGVPTETIAALFHYLRPDQGAGRGDLDAIDVLVDKVRPGLSVLDSVSELLALHGWNPNDGGDIVRAHRLARRFAVGDAAVALLDHVIKDKEGRGRWAIGSERKLSGLDGAAYALETAVPFGHGREGIVRVSVVKDRPGVVRGWAAGGRSVGELHLTSHTDDTVTMHLAPTKAEGHTFRPTVLMERVSRWLEIQPEAKSGREITLAVRGEDRGKRTAIDLLVQEGYIAVESGPHRAQLHRSVRPFRADDEGEQ